MTNTVRLTKVATRRLAFVILNADGTLLARSAEYPTICKLEAALSTLFAISDSTDSYSTERDGTTTWVRPNAVRRKVALEGDLPASRVAEALTAIASATVVDERPPHERRADLSGPLCDLAH